jgi:glutamate-1-semialdehyde 2,1-aminomutase
MAAGLATLSGLDEHVWGSLEATATSLTRILDREAEANGIPIRTASLGGMFGFHFSDRAVVDWTSASQSDQARFAQFFHAMLREGVYLAPSAFEAGFVSAAHAAPELERFETAVHSAMASLK